jgi:hypothetical protein
VVNNKDSVAAGFAWQRRESVATDDSWLRDWVLALIVTVASSLLFMIGNAHSNPRPSTKITSMDSPPHNPTAILAAALMN